MGIHRTALDHIECNSFRPDDTDTDAVELGSPTVMWPLLSVVYLVDEGADEEEAFGNVIDDESSGELLLVTGFDNTDSATSLPTLAAS